MPTNKGSISQFSDIAQGTPIDLSEYLVNQGTTTDGLIFVEFCVPYDVLPIDKIDTNAFDKYLGDIKMPPPTTSKDSLGLFDIEVPADCYMLTLFEPS